MESFKNCLKSLKNYMFSYRSLICRNGDHKSRQHIGLTDTSFLNYLMISVYEIKGSLGINPATLIVGQF